MKKDLWLTITDPDDRAFYLLSPVLANAVDVAHQTDRAFRGTEVKYTACTVLANTLTHQAIDVMLAATQIGASPNDVYLKIAVESANNKMKLAVRFLKLEPKHQRKWIKYLAANVKILTAAARTLQ